MQKNKRNFREAEDYNDEYNPTEDYSVQDGYEDLEGRWYEIEDEYRNLYPDITDEDIRVEPGRFDRTLDRIGRRRGLTTREIRSEIENW